MIVASIDKVVIMTHQNLSLGKCWKLFWATLSSGVVWFQFQNPLLHLLICFLKFKYKFYYLSQNSLLWWLHENLWLPLVTMRHRHVLASIGMALTEFLLVHVHWASGSEKLLSQKENLLVPNEWRTLSSSPDLVPLLNTFMYTCKSLALVYRA